MNIFLVIPSYNEGSRLLQTVKEAQKYISPPNIIVVDDASIHPEKLIKISDVFLLRHRINLGKGAAMRTGADFAFSQGADAIIFMDADRQHDPKELTNYIKHLNNGYDVVFGSRRPNPSAPFLRVLGKKLIGIYIRIFFGITISDILSGYRGINRRTYKLIRWQSDRYDVETEMIVRLGKYKNKIKWIEFPIDTIYIDKYKGVTPIDAIRLLVSSVFWRLSR